MVPFLRVSSERHRALRGWACASLSPILQKFRLKGHLAYLERREGLQGMVLASRLSDQNLGQLIDLGVEKA